MTLCLNAPLGEGFCRLLFKQALPRALFVWVLSATQLFAADWLTFGHDPQRTGWAVNEVTLTPQNVNGLELKWGVRLKNEPLSLNALTTPVVATDVTTPQGIRTLIYLAGSSNQFYALDSNDGSLVWSVPFETHVLAKDEGFYLCPNSINATPTIDRTKNVVYSIAADGMLYGMDLGTGKIKFGPVQFVPAFSKNWSLNLSDGIIYTSISQGCGGALSGVYSMEIIDATHPVTRVLFLRKRYGAGVWGRGGPVIGKNKAIYCATGDGAFDPSVGDFGSSFVAASLSDLKLLDYYTLTNWREINKYDLDISSAGQVWFAYRNYNLLAGGGKESVIYLLNADCLGGKDHHTPLFTTPPLANDEKALEQKGIWGAPSAWTDDDGQTWLYVPIWGAISESAPKFPRTNGPTPHGCIMAFKVKLDSFSQGPTLEPAWVSPDFNLPDPPVIANGVIFALSTGENPQQNREGAHDKDWKKNLLTTVERSANTRPAVLYALDARTGSPLYQSGSAMTGWIHFSGLAVANGRVYAVDHDSKVYCFGLKGK
jgi:outer membrane protein assembly factor BamB